MDYENDCNKCGKCCSPGIYFHGEYVRAKDLRCIFLGDDNLCTVYDKRKSLDYCKSPYELGELIMPEGCAFGGRIREISGKEQEELKAHPPEELKSLLNTKLFVWR